MDGSISKNTLLSKPKTMSLILRDILMGFKLCSLETSLYGHQHTTTIDVDPTIKVQTLSSTTTECMQYQFTKTIARREKGNYNKKILGKYFPSRREMTI